MRKLLPIFLLSLAVLFCSQIKAQCNLKPVLTPNNLILCPDGVDTLYTAKEYDSYQWFRFNKLIPGATQRYLVVNYSEDASTLFKVKVTKGNCTDTSKKVLVDGYAFASPVIITNGSPSYIDPNTGSSVFCKNDPVSLTFPEPYTENVQWYNNGKPIPGADSSTYIVTGNGSYTVCGAPNVCPAFTQCEGIPVTIAIDKFIPTINRAGDTLAASGGKTFQWYLNGMAIAGATSPYYLLVKKGFYTVVATDKYNCSATSKPVLFTASKNSIVIIPNPAHDFIIIHSNIGDAAQIVISDVYGNRRQEVLLTTPNQRIAVSSLPAGTYIVHMLDKNGNEISSAKLMKR